MPGLTEDLKDLVSHASCSFPGYPEEPVHDMRRASMELLEKHGAEVRELDLGEGKPAIYGDMPGPEGAPTVLLYAHYDVQPAPVEAGWDTDPWKAELKDGRLYGRGAADDKSGVIIHAGTLGVFQGDLPVNLRILIEGEEETVSHIGPYVDANPELFQADTYVIADMGNPAAGVPAVTTTLRGNVVVVVKVSALHHPAHSGLFGGAAPDALLALIKILASLHDDAGDTIVPGLAKFEWSGSEMDPDAFREAAGMVDGAQLIGSGTVGARLWSRPAASVIGIDAPTVKDAANVVIPEAAAKISMRVPPGADSENEVGLLIEHLKNVGAVGCARRGGEGTGRLSVRSEDGRARGQGCDGGDGRGLRDRCRLHGERWFDPVGGPTPGNQPERRGHPVGSRGRRPGEDSCLERECGSERDRTIDHCAGPDLADIGRARLTAAHRRNKARKP